jgi:hypothetical protein
VTASKAVKKNASSEANGLVAAAGFEPATKGL